MRIWKMIGLGLLVATFWTATGFSFPHDGMGGDGAGLGGPGLWHLLRALNLTDTQKTQVHDLFAAHRSDPNVQALRDQIRATQQQLVDLLLSSPSSDPTALTQQLASQRDLLLQDNVGLAQKLFSALPPEQATQAAPLTGQLPHL